MSVSDLLYYNEYEQFYAMAEKSAAFSRFCKKAFGTDFSQDGFSDVRQIDRILPYIPADGDAHILDIGCGNGKMLGYLQEKTGAYIHGFDYSEQAIASARRMFPEKSEFIQGCIGDVSYEQGIFDVITSMDTIYFAPDMSALINQVMQWLKKDGFFIVGYQEGDIMPKTENQDTTVLAQLLIEKNIPYHCIDLTRESYDLLLRKREAALFYEQEFAREGNTEWFSMLLNQTDYADKPFPEYKKELARYLYCISACKKQGVPHVI